MKKICLLSGMIVLGVVMRVDAVQKLTEEQLQEIKNVLYEKRERQRELARPALEKYNDISILFVGG